MPRQSDDLNNFLSNSWFGRLFTFVMRFLSENKKTNPNGDVNRAEHPENPHTKRHSKDAIDPLASAHHHSRYHIPFFHHHTKKKFQPHELLDIAKRCFLFSTIPGQSIEKAIPKKEQDVFYHPERYTDDNEILFFFYKSKTINTRT